MSKPWQNCEGYSDPTAYEGMKPVIREDVEREKRLNTLIFVLKYIIRLNRFNEVQREFTFSHSGESGVFTHHQEIYLELWKGWA